MLDDIVASVRDRLPAVVGRGEDFRGAALEAPPSRGLRRALQAEGLSIIAEVKRRSPSAGVIAENLDPAALAARYEAGGAAAMSVLTEPEHFGGSLEDLTRARAATSLPVLRKDFTLHPAQVWEGRASGADAVLLIVAILSDGELEELLAATRQAGLDALVEVHSRAELERALQLGADLVGVNNRDLATFTVDLSTAESLRKHIPGDIVTVAESGVSSVAGAERMAAAGYDAVLVGEAAVRSTDPAGFVASLRGAA